MEVERKMLIDTLKNDVVVREYLVYTNYAILKKFGVKCEEVSEKSRNLANALLMQDQHSAEKHEIILKLLNKSIAYAQIESEELSLSYGSRSSFFMHMNKIEESLVDVNKAIEITSCDEYKVKLLCHKADCLRALGSSEYEKCLKKAKFILKKVFTDRNTKNFLRELIEMSGNDVVERKSAENKLESDINEDKEEESYTIDSVTFKSDSEHGKYLIANRDFQPGEIICTEEFHATTLSPKKQYKNCHNCLRASLNLIPCDFCNWAMFCSEKCKIKAYEYHKSECLLIPVIENNYKEYLFECQSVIRLLILALNEGKSIEGLRKMIKEIDNEIDPVAVIDEKKLESKLITLYRLESKTEQLFNNCDYKLTLFILFIKLSGNRMLEEYPNISKVEDLIDNENLLFLGCLFLRLWKIKVKHVVLLGYHREKCNLSLTNMSERHKEYCFSIGYGLGILNNFLRHSCNPNVNKIITNKKMILYAVQPVKKNDKLFICDVKPFDDFEVDRQLKHLQQADIQCNCVSCKMGCPINVTHKFFEPLSPEGCLARRQSKREVEEVIKNIFEFNEDFNCEEFDYAWDEKIVEKLSQCALVALKLLPSDCLATCHCYRIINQAFQRKYMFKEISLDKDKFDVDRFKRIHATFRTYF